MYYNTTNENGKELKSNTGKAKKQDAQVLDVIQNISKTKYFFSCKDIAPYFKENNTPITSIRRSINTLYNLGFIDKTGDRVMGLYGRKELQYTLRVKENQ